jgi:hypothetical protein
MSDYRDEREQRERRRRTMVRTVCIVIAAAMLLKWQSLSWYKNQGNFVRKAPPLLPHVQPAHGQKSL